MLFFLQACCDSLTNVSKDGEKQTEKRKIDYVGMVTNSEKVTFQT
jgi:hypothetical protein